MIFWEEEESFEIKLSLCSVTNLTTTKMVPQKKIMSPLELLPGLGN